MEDEAFLAAFEAGDIGRLSDGGLSHEAHVRVAWLALRRDGLPGALASVGGCLRRLTASHGVPEKYHETVTWGFVFLINERMHRRPPEESWESFAARNADLIEDGASLLDRYWSQETLCSDLARRTFLLPDRVGQRSGGT